MQNTNLINSATPKLYLDRFCLPPDSATSIIANIVSHAPKLLIERYRYERDSVIAKCSLLRESIEVKTSEVVNREIGNDANGVFAVFLPSSAFSTVDSLCVPMPSYEIGFYSNEKKYRYLPQEFLTSGGGINVTAVLATKDFAKIVGLEATSMFNKLFTEAIAIFNDKGYAPIDAMLKSTAEWLIRMAGDTETPLSQSFEYVADELIARLGEL